MAIPWWQWGVKKRASVWKQFPKVAFLMRTSLKPERHYPTVNHKSMIWNVHIKMNAFDSLLVPDVQVSTPSRACWLSFLMKSKYHVIGKSVNVRINFESVFKLTYPNSLRFSRNKDREAETLGKFFLSLFFFLWGQKTASCFWLYLQKKTWECRTSTEEQNK